MAKFLHWVPRILAVIFILFISVFALDAFGEGIPFLQGLVGFLIHLVPTYILIAALLLALKKPLLGGILFVCAGLFYIIFANEMDWLTYALIAGPAILIGSLFILNAVLTQKE